MNELESKILSPYQISTQEPLIQQLCDRCGHILIREKEHDGYVDYRLIHTHHASVLSLYRYVVSDAYSQHLLLYGFPVVWHLEWIQILPDERNRGNGTAVMKQLVDLADELQVLFTLEYDERYGVPNDKLRCFYERFGFVKTDVDCQMIRMPH